MICEKCIHNGKEKICKACDDTGFNGGKSLYYSSEYQGFCNCMRHAEIEIRETCSVPTEKDCMRCCAFVEIVD